MAEEIRDQPNEEHNNQIVESHEHTLHLMEEDYSDLINEDSEKGVQTASLKVNEENAESGGFNRGEIDGLFCPICMDAWTNGGNHQVCCLPCGHIYGLSCIKKWIQRNRNSRKCPQCNQKCSLKDVRVLYASRVVAADEELRKKVLSLEAKFASLEKKKKLENGEWLPKKESGEGSLLAAPQQAPQESGEGSSSAAPQQASQVPLPPLSKPPSITDLYNLMFQANVNINHHFDQTFRRMDHTNQLIDQVDQRIRQNHRQLRRAYQLAYPEYEFTDSDENDDE